MLFYQNWHNLVPSLTNALSMVHGLLSLWYCIFSTQTLSCRSWGDSKTIYYLHYRASPTSKLLRRICLEGRAFVKSYMGRVNISYKSVFEQCGADAIVRWRWRCCIFISLSFIVTIICQDKEYLSYFKMKLCPVIPDYLSIINSYGMMDVKSQTLDMKNDYFFITFFIDA